MSGVIYKIVTGNEVYVGSTTDFKNRKRQHRCCIYNENSKHYNNKLYKTIRANDGEWELTIYDDNLSISKKELRIREEELRVLLGATLNEMRAYTSKETKDKEKVNWIANWRINNKEQYLQKNRETIICECGVEITKRNLGRHRTSAKHIKLMTSHETA